MGENANTFVTSKGTIRRVELKSEKREEPDSLRKVEFGIWMSEQVGLI